MSGKRNSPGRPKRGGGDDTRGGGAPGIEAAEGSAEIEADGADIAHTEPPAPGADSEQMNDANGAASSLNGAGLQNATNGQDLTAAEFEAQLNRGPDAIVALVRNHQLKRNFALMLQDKFEFDLAPEEQSRVYKGLARAITSEPDEQRRRELSSNVRVALKPWDAIVVCADLAAVPDNFAEDRIIERRMEVLAREPFYWDAKIKALDFTLYQRGEQGSDQANAEQESRQKKLDLQHCYAFRPEPGSTRAEVQNYRENLMSYMKKHGSTIDLDGHISRDPRYAMPKHIGPTRNGDVAFGDHHVFVAPVEKRKAEIGVEADGKSKLGSDKHFIGEVVEASFGIAIDQEPIVHFMEGIDKNFSDDSKRSGITAHMFLVYSDPEDVQGNSELVRNLQLMLLRFCAYYMDHEAAKKEAEAKRESERATRVAELAQSRREDLRKQAQTVQASIKTLNELASDMEAAMAENADVSKFIRWLGDLQPLFRTGEPLPLRGVRTEVLGNHNVWTHDQLAAALWSYARLDPPSQLKEGAELPITDLWNLSLNQLPYSEMQSRLECMIIHRLGVFESMKRVSKEQITLTFNAMKRWNNSFKQQFGESASKTQFQISQILFLFGQKSFMDKDLDDASFDFTSQTMLEGLINFVNNIDRGLNDDKLRSTLGDSKEDLGISGGLKKVTVEIAKSTGDISEREREILSEMGEKHLIVRIEQDHRLSTRRPEGRKAEDLETTIKGNFAALLDGAAGFGKHSVKYRPDKTEQNDQRDRQRDKWREDWSRGGNRETSRNLAKSMGLSEAFDFKVDDKTVPLFADASADREKLIASSWVYLDDEATNLVRVECDPANHTYEFRFRWRPSDPRFSAHK